MLAVIVIFAILIGFFVLVALVDQSKENQGYEYKKRGWFGGYEKKDKEDDDK